MPSPESTQQLFVQVNVYKSNGAWYVHRSLRRAGASFPKIVEDYGSIRVRTEGTGLKDACYAAAEALFRIADSDD